MLDLTINHAKTPKALLVFAHGAGADKNHEFLQQITDYFIAEEISVIRFNFPYMDKRLLDGKRRPPDRMPVLLACYHQVIQQVNKLNLPLPIFIGGKSMGARVAVTLLSENTLSEANIENIKGAVCIGYPFHPQKKPDNLRLAPLEQSNKPILICQGERDALGSKAEIETYQLNSFCHLTYFTDGDHDLKPRVKSGFTHQQHKLSAAQAISRFIDEHS